MRAFLGEYGKVIICVIVTGIIFAYVFSFQSNSVAASIPSPNVTVKSEDSFPLVQDVSSRKNPVLTVTSNRLSKNTTYNLLSSSVVTAKNQDGAYLDCHVINLVYPNGTIKTGQDAENGAKNFISDKEGPAKVTYRVVDNYKGREVITKETCVFVID